jgi:hypothetical protein
VSPGALLKLLCPEGKPLKYVGINKLNRTHNYHSTAKRCRGCVQKPQCTRGKYRILSLHTCEAARQKAYGAATTPEFAVAPYESDGKSKRYFRN